MDEDCIRLTSYFRDRQRADGKPLADALTSLYARGDVAASIVLRGTDGSSAAIAVGPRPGIEALLGQVAELCSPGLVTVERARLLTGDIDAVRPGAEPGAATMLTIHFARQDRVYQVPAFEAACELLYRRGIAGATVLPGTEGTLRGRRQYGQHPPLLQHPPLFQHGGNAPLMLIAVGSDREIAMLLPELGALFRHPVMTTAKVQVCGRDGRLAGAPPVLPAGEPEGPQAVAARLQVTVCASEATRHEGQPAHRALARQLGMAGVESVTTVHGIWGFHADHAPHGDHFPHRGRHVQVVTMAAGPPGRVAAALDAAGPLTAERGLVTVRAVLAVRPGSRTSGAGG